MTGSEASSVVWDPVLYERYKLYRDRPALDLLLQIPGGLDPKEIWDLGCGTGEHAALLAGRHPQARVHGLDASSDMLAVARVRTAAVHWVRGDIAAFAPEVAPDLIFTNAALQWLEGHQTLFPALMRTLAPGGVLACQVPISHEAHWHEALREVVAGGAWAERLANVRSVRPVSAPEAYYDWLAPLSETVDIWSTTYLHVLEGEDPVVEWMSGTALRPYTQALTDPFERDAFIQAYRERMAAVFPQRLDGTTLFPFPRMFMVARRR
jgi:trans-aconitate 2-methyltransferase